MTRAPRFVFPLPRLLSALAVAGAILLAGCQSARPLEQAPAALDDAAPARPGKLPAGSAPVEATDECCDVADLWDRVRAGFAMDLAQDNDRISAQRNWYIRNQDYLDRVVARSSRYLRFVVDECEARGIPMEMALLPIVESAWDPLAYSHAHAAGPWQFIPSTGRIYGLRQDWWYDGRRDIEYSTRAALDYLSRLAERFDGDWEKALASYNAGAGTVSRAVNRNLRASKKTDFWSLKLPRETSAYVPKLIAISQIVADPERYGVRLNPVPDRARFEFVEIGRPVDLARAAEMADMPLAELYLYNPAYNRWTTGPQGPHRLLVPVENAQQLRNALSAAGDEPLEWFSNHEVAAGETVESIARAYSVSPEAVQAYNGLKDDALRAGQQLRIPEPRRVLALNETSYDPRVSLLNDPAKRAAGQRIAYTVKPGDTLYKIAGRHRVAMRDLARWNNISPSAPLRIGQRLTIVGGKGSAPVAAPGGSAAKDGKRVAYQVNRGDTLSGIARRFKVSVSDIARWNDFSPQRMLRAGERLTLFVD